MKKTDLIMPTLVLTVICLVASAALAYTNQTTVPLIEEAEAKAANEARTLVLPEGDSFSRVEDVNIENVAEVYSADNGAGYAITTIAKGYGGDIKVMVGINGEGIVTGTKLMSHNETPGLGARVGEEEGGQTLAPLRPLWNAIGLGGDEAGGGVYASQYVGKDSSLADITAISGATISSTAYKAAVETAFLAFGEVAGVELGGTGDPRENLFPGVELTPITLEGAKEAYRAAGQGYLIVTTALGYYDDEMEVLVAVGPDGKIIGTALGENKETAGVGSRVGESAYTDQYAGRDITNYSEVTAVTGATVSSDAFKRGVKKAMELVTPELLNALAEEVPAA